MLALGLVVLTVSAGYVDAVGLAVPHQSLTVEVGWSLPTFNASWSLEERNTSSGFLVTGGSTLTVGAPGPLDPGVEVNASSDQLPSFNLSRFPFLSVQVQTASVYVAVDIDLGNLTGTGRTTIVLSTFDDGKPHTIYVDLRTFGFQGTVQFPSIHLGFLVVQQGVYSAESVQFGSLSLVQLSGG